MPLPLWLLLSASRPSRAPAIAGRDTRAIMDVGLRPFIVLLLLYRHANLGSVCVATDKSRGYTAAKLCRQQIRDGALLEVLWRPGSLAKSAANQPARTTAVAARRCIEPMTRGS